MRSTLMKSMTGFGRGECVSRGVRYSVEISTVNRRNAELVFNLSRELAPQENILRDLLAPAIARGRATVSAATNRGATARKELDPALFRRLHSELKRIQSSLGIPGTPTLADLVRLYATVAHEDASGQPVDAEALGEAARSAIRSLDAMRAKEGAHLAAELRRLLAALAAHVKTITRLAPQVSENHRQSMRARLSALDPSFAADDERLARELALFADRCDITEELSRLGSHIAQFRAGLAAKEPVGRSLDFLAQEMFRECNTIGSKANSADMARHVIAAKTELERMREQVQNVE